MCETKVSILFPLPSLLFILLYFFWSGFPFFRLNWVNINTFEFCVIYFILLNIPSTSQSSLQITMILWLHNIKDYKTRFTNIIKKCSRKLYQPFYRFIMYDITFWLTSCKGICIKKQKSYVRWLIPQIVMEMFARTLKIIIYI